MAPKLKLKHLILFKRLHKHLYKLLKELETIIPEHVVFETLTEQYCNSSCPSFEKLDDAFTCNDSECLINRVRELRNGFEICFGYPVEIHQWLKKNREKLHEIPDDVRRKIMEVYEEAKTLPECSECDES